MKKLDGRLVVFTGDFNYTVRRNIVDLETRVAGLSWLVLVHSPVKTPGKLLKSQRLNFRKHGWRWVPYQLRDLLARLVPQRTIAAATGVPGSEYELEALRTLSNVRICKVADIHAESSLALVREFNPDLGLSLAAPILRSELFTLPLQGTINLHKGGIPNFRGMPPAFWELWTEQDEIGCSIHKVSEKLDEGVLLAETSVPRERYSTLRGLQLRLDEIGSELVCHVVEAMLAGNEPSLLQPKGEGKTWRKPTLAQQSKLRKRLARLDPPTNSQWSRGLKDVFVRLAFVWHHFAGWRLSAPRVTVLLYHRVCDDARNNLSVGVAQFERQMQLLREHCEILSIDQLLAIRLLPRSRRPLVAVTFDDGYLDNFLNAAPILRRQCVPCSFYVSTGIVESENGFPHDRLRGYPSIPALSWTHLRQMRAWGFTIGSHTVSHIDCVAESEDAVRTELARSRDDLIRELGPIDPIFAYPYGGRQQMNETRLVMVREAGYRACLAAYGGSNISFIDRWNVLRRGIHWEYSESAFLYQCLGR